MGRGTLKHMSPYFCALTHVVVLLPHPLLHSIFSNLCQGPLAAITQAVAQNHSSGCTALVLDTLESEGSAMWFDTTSFNVA
eukprot:m.167753 g.167753  ORF g.167753 m.167753 type:complete len:81 (+) comp14467_c0_seq4:3065-3307(+)